MVLLNLPEGRLDSSLRHPTHTHRHTHTQTHTHTHTDTHTQTHTHTRTHTHKRTRTHTRARTHTHAHMNTRMHTRALGLAYSEWRIPTHTFSAHLPVLGKSRVTVAFCICICISRRDNCVHNASVHRSGGRRSSLREHAAPLAVQKARAQQARTVRAVASLRCQARARARLCTRRLHSPIQKMCAGDTRRRDTRLVHRSRKGQLPRQH